MLGDLFFSVWWNTRTLPADFIMYNGVNVLAILMSFQGRFRNVMLLGCPFKPRSRF
jgi:hypothetical protein